MSVHKQGWHVVVESARDNFQELTQAGHLWLAGGDSTERWQDLIGAIAAVTNHPLWESELRHVPRVGYDPNSDGPCFLFKLENNGTTFIVSRFPEWEGE